MWRYFFWEENRKWRWRFCFIASFFITFMNALEPLKGGIVTYQYNYYFYNMNLLFMIFTNTIFFVFIVPKIFPQFFKLGSWTSFRFYTWFIILTFCCSISSFGYDIYFNNVNDFLSWGAKYYLQYQIPILLFDVIPLWAFFIIFNPNGNSINISTTDFLGFNQIDLVEKVVLEIKDANGKVELNISQSNLYFFKASDNYIEIFHKNTEGVNRVVIRNTLKDIQNQFSDIPQLFRCHKAFIINTEKVKEVSGNAKGYFLTLEDVSEKIPVSRSNIEEMKICLPTFFE